MLKIVCWRWSGTCAKYSTAIFQYHLRLRSSSNTTSLGDPTSVPMTRWASALTSDCKPVYFVAFSTKEILAKVEMTNHWRGSQFVRPRHQWLTGCRTLHCDKRKRIYGSFISNRMLQFLKHMFVAKNENRRDQCVVFKSVLSSGSCCAIFTH